MVALCFFFTFLRCLYEKCVSLSNKKSKQKKTATMDDQACIDLPLRTYQVKPAQWMVKHPNQKGLYIAYSTGTGKTYTLTELIAALMQKGIINRVIAITPAKLKTNLHNSLLRCLNQTQLPSEITIDSFEGIQRKRMVVNAQTMIVVDEAHKLRNPSTSRYKTVQKLVDRAGRVILLSATPAMTRMENLTPQLNLLLPKTERIPFNTRWTDLDGRLLQSDKLYALLRERVAFYDISGTPEDTRPQVRYFKVLVPMGPQQAKMIRAVLKEHHIVNEKALIAALGEDATGGRSNAFMNKVRRFANAGSYTDCASPKIQKAVQLLTEASGPAMLYSSWLDMGGILVQRCLERAGVPASLIGMVNGNTTESQLASLLEGYNGSQTIRFLLLSAAAQEGINTKGTNRFIVLEPQWQKLAEDQAIARAVRLDSHPKGGVVDVYYLCSHHATDPLLNIDERLFDMNRRKYASIHVLSTLLKQASIPLEPNARVPQKKFQKDMPPPPLPKVKVLNET
jgi:hypothetical protein